MVRGSIVREGRHRKDEDCTEFMVWVGRCWVGVKPEGIKPTITIILGKSWASVLVNERICENYRKLKKSFAFETKLGPW